MDGLDITPYDDPQLWTQQQSVFGAESEDMTTIELGGGQLQRLSTDQHGWKTFQRVHENITYRAREHRNVAYNPEDVNYQTTYSSGASCDDKGYYEIVQGRPSLQRQHAAWETSIRLTRSNRFGNVCQDCALELNKMARYETIQRRRSTLQPSGATHSEVVHWWAHLIKDDDDLAEDILLLETMHGKRRQDSAGDSARMNAAVEKLRVRLNPAARRGGQQPHASEADAREFVSRVKGADVNVDLESISHAMYYANRKNLADEERERQTNSEGSPPSLLACALLGMVRFSLLMLAVPTGAFTLSLPMCTRALGRVMPPKMQALAEMPPSASEPLAICTAAAETKSEDGEAVVDALLTLERDLRNTAKTDGGALSRATLAALNGSWRLIFTTGTVDMQNKLGGRINYFPLRAVQSFDTSSMAITNGIYLGEFEVLKFYGEFDWLEDRRRLEYAHSSTVRWPFPRFLTLAPPSPPEPAERTHAARCRFDFDTIALFGFKIGLPKGGAAEIGASTGLGSKSNVQKAKAGKKAFFNWISADPQIATARGGGGGLALWKRER